MPYSSLTEFIEFLEKKGELLRVPDEIDPILEITAFADKVSKSPQGGKAILFEKPKGSPFPVLINAFGSRKRMGSSTPWKSRFLFFRSCSGISKSSRSL